jgi:metal-responsive CopG/Arc/MetJ family transcriptional regulator
MTNKNHLGSITILVENRQALSTDVQKILTENGHLIMARMGVNVQRICVEHCTGLMVIAVEGTKKEIDYLANKLDSLYGVIARVAIVK